MTLQLSHPVRVRGLKRAHYFHTIIKIMVAPRAGAWIETERKSEQSGGVYPSHPVRVRGLKPLNTAGLSL